MKAINMQLPLKTVIVSLLLIGFSKMGIAQVAGLPSTLPEVKYHLTARPWKPLNISRDVYLDKVEGIVREIAKYQNLSGAIIDPYAQAEVQYSTPYFAYAVGVLLSAGRATDLLANGVAAMNSATTDVAAGASAIPDDHGEFFLTPLANGIPLYTMFVSASQLQIWKTRMAKPVDEVIRGRTHNWRTYAMRGEWYRAKNGYVNKDSAVKWIEDSWMNTQKTRFTNNSWNFYHDQTSSPDTWPYESAARGNLLAMIADGYTGVSKNEISTILKNASQSSLLYQDPSGQGIAGGRTCNHTWNDIVLANGYETLAEIMNKEGNSRLAGQYRHAAALGFESVQRWRQANGTYSVTKNQFSPAMRVRFSSTYSFLTNYNGYMMFHMSENYLRHTSIIEEQPTPNEIGGYTIVSDTSLATVGANAGGMHIEVCLRGSTELEYNLYWTALGAVRFARTGWDSRLGPSDGVRETEKKFGVSFAPVFLENGKWLRMSSIPERYEAFFSTQFTHPLLVRCRLQYKPKPGKTGPVFTTDFVITPDGILSTLTSTSTQFGVTWPILTFDGAALLNTSVTSHIASTSFPGAGDQQNFIALHSSPTITATEAARRSSYGDLLPVRMVSNTTDNVTFIYPRNSADPSAESVRTSYTHRGSDFSTILGKVNGNMYVGRTSAGGEGTGIDLNNDSTIDASFSKSCGFLMQLDKGAVTKIETDRSVSAIIQGQSLNLQAYTPLSIIKQFNKVAISSVIASSTDGNIPANTIDMDFDTRWSASGNNQWIRYKLDTTTMVKTIKIAWYKGDERNSFFDIQLSSDGSNWTTVYTGYGSGTTAGFEIYTLTPHLARYVRIVSHGNNLNNWNGISEMEIFKDPQISPPTVVAIGAVADAFVRNGSYANTNYGSDTALVVKSSTVNGFSRFSYLKFSLSNISNVTSAKLRVYSRTTENTVSVNLSSFGVNNDSWIENGITFTNAPAASTSSLSSVVVNEQAKYYELDVTNYVKAQLAGDGIVTLLIKDTTGSNQALSFNSKESLQNPPQLIIESASSGTGVIAIAPPTIYDKVFGKIPGINF